MANTRVGVVRGGPSSEYEVSLRSGGEVLRHLPENYKGYDILLDKKGDWYLDGFPQKPAKIFSPSAGGVDVIFNALHGEFGEDGRVQQVFEDFNMPYTGSTVVPSALAMKKHLARELFSRYGIKIPHGIVFHQDNDEFLRDEPEYFAKQVFNAMPPLWVVKPASCGSSVGVSICGSFEDLVRTIEKAFSYDDTVIVEEYIKGREATCGVLENFRDKQEYVLPPVEILPAFAKASAGEPPFFDYEAKYNGLTREICPASFDLDVKRQLEEIAGKAHQILGCRHYSRSDFVVSERGIYLLEVNTLPGLTAESLFPKAAAAAGLEFPFLLDHILKLALNRR